MVQWSNPRESHIVATTRFNWNLISNWPGHLSFLQSTLFTQVRVSSFQTYSQTYKYLYRSCRFHVSNWNWKFIFRFERLGKFIQSVFISEKITVSYFLVWDECIFPFVPARHKLSICSSPRRLPFARPKFYHRILTEYTFWHRVLCDDKRKSSTPKREREKFMIFNPIYSWRNISQLSNFKICFLANFMQLGNVHF